ncbi:MAG: hypothetical protein WBA68_12270 [Alteraurantiacibacter sp.]
MTSRRPLLAAAAILALSACDRSEPPVKQLEQAAETAVEDVTGDAPPQQAKGPYAPRDGCSDKQGGRAFLAALRSAVSARDAEAVAALAADDIRLDFGGGSGKALLVERLEDGNRGLWKELDELLTLGCASDGATLTMPWYFAQDYPDALDASTYGLVTGEDVPFYAGTGPDRRQVASISWDKVEYVEPDESGMQLRWTDPDTGETVMGQFADDSVLRSHFDYRLLAARRNDRWRITGFVAGD